MGLVDDLNRLSELHAAGQLSDEEFEEAKTRMIRESTGTVSPAGDTAGGLDTTGYDPTLTPPLPPLSPGPTGTAAATGPTAKAPPAPGTTSTTVHGARPATTVVTTGLGTGSVTLGSLPPQTRLRTRVQGLTAPSSVEPQRSAKRTFFTSLGCLTIPILFAALMIATAGVAMFPGLARLSAPVLCDAPYDHSYVDITQSNPVPGETYIEWELQCYNDRGTVQAADDFKVMGIVFVEAVVMLFGIVLVLSLIAGLRRRAKNNKQDEPIQPVPPSGSLSDLSNSGGPIINPPS